MPDHQQIQQSKKPDTSFQKQATPVIQTPVSNPFSIIQRAKINPKSLTHADIMQLQRTIGNQAVGRLLSSIGNTSTAQQATVQRQEIPEEEESLQGKMIETIQRQEIPEEEEPLQGKFGGIQRQEIPEEEEPLQGKMIEPLQRQEVPEEEELLQGKMIETVQMQEIPEEEEPLQGKMAETVQRQEIPEEEPLQGKFENKPEMACTSCFVAPIVQKQEIPEEEEPLQGKFESIQRQEIPEEEEPLQGKMIGTVQRQEILEEEEPLQGKFENIQRQEIPEEEEPLQGKFEDKPEIACPSSFAAPLVQRQEIPEEEEPLQGKMIRTVQRQEIPEGEEPVQTKKENNTGMPDNLKAGVESLSGIDMSDVRVHYNSNKPADVGALAYTQGTDIHVAPGQEQNLPHETWHVVQQKQDRVKPTMQLKDVAVNDDADLEHEADEMGRKTLQAKGFKKSPKKENLRLKTTSSITIVQRIKFRTSNVPYIAFPKSTKTSSNGSMAFQYNVESFKKSEDLIELGLFYLHEYSKFKKEKDEPAFKGTSFNATLPIGEKEGEAHFNFEFSDDNKKATVSLMGLEKVGSHIADLPGGKEGAIKKLKDDFKIKEIVDGGAPWKEDELAKMYAAFALMSETEQKALEGVVLERVSELPKDKETSTLALYEYGPDPKGIDFQSKKIIVSNLAFSGDSPNPDPKKPEFAASFGKTKEGKLVPISFQTILHEVGHAVEVDTYLTKDMEHEEALRDYNAEVESCNILGKQYNEALDEGRAEVKKWYEFRDKHLEAMRLKIEEIEQLRQKVELSDIKKKNMYTINRNVIVTKRKKLTEFNNALVKELDTLSCKMPEVPDEIKDLNIVELAQTVLRAYVKCKELKSKFDEASKKLADKKATKDTKKASEDRVYSKELGTTRIQNFVAYVNKYGIEPTETNPLTDYALKSWKEGKYKEYYAEAYSLFYTNPDFLRNKQCYNKLYNYFHRNVHTSDQLVDV